MSLTVAITAKPCHYCGSYHSTLCPRIEEIEYHGDGTVKRVRLRDALAGPDTPADVMPEDHPAWPGTQYDTSADSQEDKT